MKIISIDPGYERMGVAVIEKNISDKKETLLFSDCIKTEAKEKHPLRLQKIGEELQKIIKKFEPECLAIEKLYFSNNQKTALLVSEARGVILYEGSKNNLKIFEYTPADIKIALTGYGLAPKKQVLEMVKKLINVKKEIKYDDEFDAIAIGLTCFAIEKTLIKQK